MKRIVLSLLALSSLAAEAAADTCWVQPWDREGVTASYVYGNTQTVISRDLYWTIDVRNGQWGAAGHLSGPWAGAPTVDGLRPWDGPGVTASYVYGTTQTVISVDRYWTIDLKTATWGAHGHLSAAPWAFAPAVTAACE